MRKIKVYASEGFSGEYVYLVGDETVHREAVLTFSVPMAEKLNSPEETNRQLYEVIYKAMVERHGDDVQYAVYGV